MIVTTVPAVSTRPTLCGLGCTTPGQPCAGCASNPANRGGALRGLGLTLPDISGLPAPLNSWPVLIGLILAALFIFGGGAAALSGKAGRRKALRKAGYKAQAERARLLAAE